MKKIIITIFLSLILIIPAWAADIDVDVDSNNAVDVNKGGTNSTTAAAARTALGLAIGSDVEAYDAATTKSDEAETITSDWDFTAHPMADNEVADDITITAGSQIAGGTPTFTTVDSGQGANELYDMDQDVKTTSSPTFAGVTVTATPTPAIEGQDSDNAAGTFSIMGNSSGGANGVVLSIGVEEASGSEDTTYIQCDGATDKDIKFKKPVDAESNAITTTGLLSGGVVTKTAAANYTIGTTNSAEKYGGIIYVTSAATITMPAVGAGMSFTVITIGATAVSVDPNASDKMYLDGNLLDDGDKATNTSTTGDILVCTYYSADGWYCASGSNDGDLWTDGS